MKIHLDTAIKQCELEYIRHFCDITYEDSHIIRFRDDMIFDMYYHNFTLIKNADNDIHLTDTRNIRNIIEAEIQQNLNEGKQYCLIRSYIPVSDSVTDMLSHKPDDSESGISGFYQSDAKNLSFCNLKQNACIHIRQVDTDSMIEELLYLDLQHDEETLGRDFCTRRIYGMKDVYLSDTGADAYICYNDENPVGSCELFIHGKIAKIENFSVIPSQQRKGYGSMLLKSLIDKAISEKAEIIYLETDEDDTAKEMYKKFGFEKTGEITDLLFDFTN